jgi:hypothetical protein
LASRAKASEGNSQVNGGGIHDYHAHETISESLRTAARQGGKLAIGNHVNVPQAKAVEQLEERLGVNGAKSVIADGRQHPETLRDGIHKSFTASFGGQNKERPARTGAKVFGRDTAGDDSRAHDTRARLISLPSLNSRLIACRMAV